MPARMLSYRFFAKTYGWTPDQVDELSEDCYEWIPKIETAHARAAEMERRSAERAAAPGRPGSNVLRGHM